MAKPPETAYFDYQAETMPAWFAGPVAQRFFGITLSWICHLKLEGATLALKAALLTNPEQPPDAVALIGSERQLRRGPTETNAQYKARLQGAWTAWTYAGAKYAVESQLALAGFTAEVKQNSDWDWDGDTSKWARMWVVITAHPWSTGATWNDGSLWNDGTLWDISAGSAEIDTLRAIIRQWKPAHVRVENIIVVLDTGTWASEQPDGTWGDSANRSTSAIYLSG